MRIIMPFLLLFVLLSCQSKKKTDVAATNIPIDSTFTVKGKIIGLDSGWVYLYSAQRDVKYDSAKLHSGNFEFKGIAPEPQFAQIRTAGKDDNNQMPLFIFLEPGIITIQAFADSIEKATVRGGVTQGEFQKFLISRKSLDEKEKQLRTVYQQVVATEDKVKIQEIMNESKSLDNENRLLVAKFSKENPGSYVSAVQLANSFGFDPDPKELEPLYNALNEKIKSSYYGIQIKEVLASAKKAVIGEIAPDFTLNDVNGKPVSLASYKGKYVLIDFWASWCAPCRQENPTVVKAYTMYKPKGFEILGVSLDDKKENWEKAIAQDKLAWTHVSDLKGWQSNAAELYGVRGIPMNYLLDKDGKIIAKSLRGEDLIKKLGEVLN